MSAGLLPKHADPGALEQAMDLANLPVGADEVGCELKSWKEFRDAKVRAERKDKIFRTLYPNRKREGDLIFEEFIRHSLHSGKIKNSAKRDFLAQERKISHSAAPIKELGALALTKIKYKQAFLEVARESLDGSQSQSAADISNKLSEVDGTPADTGTSLRLSSENLIKQELRKVVGKVEQNIWLQREKRASEFSQALVLELANQFASLKRLLAPQLSASQSYQFVVELFKLVEKTSTKLLDDLQQMKEAIDKQCQFFDQISWDRLLAKYRAKIHKMLASDKVYRDILGSIVPGRQATPSWSVYTNPDYLKPQLQALANELDQIANHARAKLERPQAISRRIVPTTADFIQKTLLGFGAQGASSESRQLANNSPVSVKAEPASRTSPSGVTADLGSPTIEQTLTLSQTGNNAGCETSDTMTGIDRKRLILLAHSELGGGTRSPQRRWPLPPLSWTGSAITELDPRLAPSQPIKREDTLMETSREAAKPSKYLPPRPEKYAILKQIQQNGAQPKANAETSEYVKNLAFFSIDLDTASASEIDAGSQYKCQIRVPASQPTLRKVPDLISVEKQEPAPLYEILGAEEGIELDERIARQREIEELFDDIMKTLETNQWEQEKESLGNADNVADCPTAPAESSLSLAYKGMLISEEMAFTVFDESDEGGDGFSEYQKLVKRPTSSASANARNGNSVTTKPQIRLLTRSESVGALDAAIYAIDRKTAMRLTPSSKYSTFKYNYGGYIPKWSGKLKTRQGKGLKKILKKSGGEDVAPLLSLKDYKTFLKIWATDKVRALVAAEQTEEEKRRLAKIAADEELNKLRQAELRKVWEARRQRLAEKRALTKFHRRAWNAGILRYMEELADAANDELDIASKLDGKTRAFGEKYGSGSSENDDNEKILAQFQNSRLPFGKCEAEAESDPKPASLDTSKRNAVFVSETNLAVVSLQQDLESVWDMLKMPEDQRVQMAGKWAQSNFWTAKAKQFQSLANTSAAACAQVNAARPSTSAIEATVKMLSNQAEEVNTRVREALKLYKQAAEAILFREQVVKRLAEFEKFASNPERYFARGFQGSSSARLIEAGERVAILKDLKVADEQVRLYAKRISRKLHDTLTYGGVPYLLKMRRDIPEIFYALESDRRALNESRKLLLNKASPTLANSGATQGPATSQPANGQVHQITQRANSTVDETCDSQWDTENEQTFHPSPTVLDSRPSSRTSKASESPTNGGILAYLAQKQQVKLSVANGGPSRASSGKVKKSRGDNEEQPE